MKKYYLLSFALGLLFQFGIIYIPVFDFVPTYYSAATSIPALFLTAGPYWVLGALISTGIFYYVKHNSFRVQHFSKLLLFNLIGFYTPLILIVIALSSWSGPSL